MQSDIIIISEYCTKCHVEPSFISLLEEDGLIDVMEVEDRRCIAASQLADLEQYARLYYDLSINIAGIDVIHGLLKRIEQMQGEIRMLQNELRFYREDE